MADDLPYRPWRPQGRSLAHKERNPRRVAALEQAIRDRTVTNADSNASELGLLELLSGRTSRAIASFTLATEQPKTVVGALTDLSAAYLARFAQQRDPLDLLRAARAAEQGLSAAPRDPALLFNRAQALTMLGTRTLAAAAWREFSRRESAGDWRREAASSLQRLTRPTADQEWSRWSRVLASPGLRRQQIVALAERFPVLARAYAEENLLPRWAATMSRGDVGQARQLLWEATVIGEVLEQRGEGLLADALSSIQLALSEKGSGSARRPLLDGLWNFGVGVAHYHEQNLTTARDPLGRAARDLALADNPLSYWARFYLAVDAYYVDANRSLGLLEELLDEIPQSRYPGLTGRIQWIAGTADKVGGRLQSSVRRYDHAALALRRSGGEQAAAFISVQLAESYSLLGEHSVGWQYRFKAFHRVPFSEDLRRNIAMWVEAKQSLRRQGHLALAGPFVGEAAALAKRWGRPLGLATAYLDRAVYWLEVGAQEAALSDLHEAQRAIARMEESALKEQMTYLAFITEGLVYRTREPARAVSLLKRGLERQQGTGNRFETIQYTTAKAAAQLAMGELRAAAASLEEAISLFEDVRSTVEDPVSRMQAFRQAQPAFDSLLRLRTTALAGDPETPFRLAERSRARVLLELRRPSTMAGLPDAGFVSLAELEKTLPADTTLVSYAALEDELLAWVVERGRSRRLTLKIDRAELSRQIASLRLQMTRRAEEKVLRSAAAALHDALIRPLGLAPRSGGTLVIVPDRWLARLPFAPLFDRRTGRYLIEQREVTIVPSATLLVRGSRKDRRRQGELSALTIAVSRSGAFGGRVLPSLPNATREAREVAAAYDRATVLLGMAATKGNFLRSSVSADVVHFAGHAIVDLEAPRRSVLLFAGRRRDSLEPLSLGELFAVKTSKASLVVLSACRAQDSLADDREGLLGLAGAFFAAGVPEVVASPLDVDDSATVPVMVAFHRHYRRHRSAGAAFREAVLDLLRSGSPAERSPAAWGGFTVIAGMTEEDVHNEP